MEFNPENQQIWRYGEAGASCWNLWAPLGRARLWRVRGRWMLGITVDMSWAGQCAHSWPLGWGRIPT